MFYFSFNFISTQCLEIVAVKFQGAQSAFAGSVYVVLSAETIGKQ